MKELSEKLSTLNLKDYFFEMKEVLTSLNDLNSLTSLLCNGDFVERRPYLHMRCLAPKDKRFSSIELVYEEPKRVLKIRWYLNITLSALVEYFGEPRFHYTPHGSATMIGFFLNDREFTGFESIEEGNIKKSSDGYQIKLDNGNEEFKQDLNLSFVSFNIN